MFDYKNTLNLPHTKFPMRASLVTSEPIALQRWYEDDLYSMICHKKDNKKIFLLHDGPPYVNGNIHLGHAVNKVLKDIILKFKRLMGYSAPYIPGWDCHGLPVELKVERSINRSEMSMDSKKFRSICRQYVLTQIEIQRKDFIRLGVIADWFCPYLTMDFKTEANIIRTLSKVISHGYIYKGIKPVYWCFKCHSVLAESEIEYHNHFSVAVDVSFVSMEISKIIQIFQVDLDINNIELIVWTTTPWTLPANQGISVHPKYNYQLIKICNNRHIIVAADLVNMVMKRIGCDFWEILGETLGSNLEFLKFRHPFMCYDVPVLLSHHVTLDSGTGAVHISPSYGTDDYIVAQKYKFKKIVDLIDDNGYYIPNTHCNLDGKHIYHANKIIVDLLCRSNCLLHVDYTYQHKYPYCWRHMVPVIFRATSQWFLNMEKNNLRDKLLKIINEVNWIPKKGKASIEAMITNRPDWCLSRQRDWGVPMPLFIHKKTETLHPHTAELIEIVAKRVEKYGIQAWWDLKIEEVITGSEHIEYKKVVDTLDVWFDSGSTHCTVIPERFKCSNRLSDLYLEGSDQYRGWFMSSLIISTIVTGQAPYKEVLSHGFTVDMHGYKMSKSVGNIISPKEIINKFGGDILRLWVASSDYSKDIPISEDTLQHITDVYRRIRNTARFLLSNLHDFNPNKDSVPSECMVALDRWVINQALSVQLKVIEDYNRYNFHSVVQHIMQFCSIEMGSFYLDIIKDRQYTTKYNSIARRSCQTAFYHIIEAMVRWISPVLSFTADEIWRYIPGNRSKYVFTEEWYNGLFEMDTQSFMNNDYWNTFLSVRSEVNKSIEQARTSGIIKGSLEAKLILYAAPKLADQLRMLGDELAFGLMTSSAVVMDYKDCDAVIFQKNETLNLKVVLEKATERKCSRCWHYRSDIGRFENYSDICVRCVTNIIGPGEDRRFF